MQPFRLLIFVFLTVLLVACAAQTTATQVPSQPLPLATNTSQPVIIQTLTESPPPSQTSSCDDWQSWPVTPVVSDTARELYHHGQASGNNPRAFSKIGDGEISTEWFFTAFDLGEDYYDLGPYQNLRPVIEHFAGSFGRIGMTAQTRFQHRSDS